MKNAVGFRQFLKSKNSYKDLEQLIIGQKEYFPAEQNYVTIIAICGENPLSFLAQKRLEHEVELYSFAAWEEKAAKVANVFIKSRKNLDKIQIIHYSDKPEGLTYPLELLIEISKLFGFKHLSVGDSDFQLSYSEIKKTYEYHLNACKEEKALITFPRRKHRSLDAEKYPINRWAMEDLENMYIYLLSDLSVLKQKADFQSGLLIANKAAYSPLNFHNVGTWIGNLHMAIQVIHNNGILENNFVVETNTQNESTINFDVQCQKIDQLFKYYLIPISNICMLAKEHPERYLMDDWTKDKSDKQINDIINSILDRYKQHWKNRSLD